MKVKATKLGYYDLLRRREGEIFVLKSEKDFSAKWMQKIEVEKPKGRAAKVQEPEVSEE